MKKFTLDNTAGFDQSTLDKMNDEYEKTIATLDQDDFYDSNCNQIARRIFNDYNL